MRLPGTSTRRSVPKLWYWGVILEFARERKRLIQCVTRVNECNGRFIANNSATRDAPRCPAVLPGKSCLGPELAQPLGNFYSLHIENDAVFLLNVAAHISATEVGVYVRRNKEPSGRRSSPSLECSLLPG